MVRLKDIAARADVSVMTVSKVMRDAPDISKATKARIRKLAEEMGYVPDRMAQSLRSKSTRLLGLVMSAATNPIFARLLAALEDQAYELGYDIVFGYSLNQVEREETIIRRMMARRVDGLFLYPVYRMSEEATVYDDIRRMKIPTVILGHNISFSEGFVSVAPDDFSASQSLTRHLIELGHKRIAFFTGPQFAPWSQERLEGYRHALKEAGLPTDDSLVFTAGANIESGAKAALEMIEEKAGATAVQAVNDLIAIGAGSMFLQQGIRIPQDLSLVGFGNVLTSEHFRVPLTTVRQPKHRLGVAAMECMKQLLEGKSPDSRRLPAELVVRASSGPPPSA